MHDTLLTRERLTLQYLNNGVYHFEELLQRKAKDEPDQYEVKYGDRAEHCWNGDCDNPNSISRLRYNSMYVPKMMARMTAHAPEGADLMSWRY
eukprot:SAG22_NODE_506_length_9643_cov_5.853206_10_plen_93_part_00